MHTVGAARILGLAALSLAVDTLVHGPGRLNRPIDPVIRRISLTATAGADSARKALAASIGPRASWSDKTSLVDQRPAFADDRFASCDVQVLPRGVNRHRLMCVDVDGNPLGMMHAKSVDALIERFHDFLAVGAITTRSLAAITDVHVPSIDLKFASLWMTKNHSEVREYLLTLLRSDPTINVLPDVGAARERRDRFAILEIREAGTRSTELWGTTYTAIVLKDSEGRPFREFVGDDGLFGSLREDATVRQGLTKAVAAFLRERRTDADVAAGR